MATELPYSAISEIACKARISNQALNVTGVLIFDGVHFCGLLEGRPADTVALLDSILLDTRHTDVQVLVNTTLKKRRFSDFLLGYASGDDTDVLVRLKQLRGVSAVKAFDALLPDIDLG